MISLSIFFTLLITHSAVLDLISSFPLTYDTIPIFPASKSQDQQHLEKQSDADDHFYPCRTHLNRKAEIDFSRRHFQLNHRQIGFDSRDSLDSTSFGWKKNPYGYLFRQYRQEDVVKCLDCLSTKKNQRPFHIAFVGDSTVRQHFLSFIRVKRQAAKGGRSEYTFQEDRNVTSPLLNHLLVSFRWRAMIQDEIIEDFKGWITNKYNQSPDFLLLGLTAHHIQTNNISRNLQEYKEILEDKLLPVIKQSFDTNSQQEIIWLRQSPTSDYLGPGTDSMHHEVHVDKIAQYNNVITSVFRKTRVVIWDSVNSIVEEYLRGCALTRLLRQDRSHYFNCDDFIHPGFGALSIASQLIINHICRA